MLLAVEDDTGDLKTADAAEMRVIQEMRETGKVALQSWAERQLDKVSVHNNLREVIVAQALLGLCYPSLTV